MGCDREKRPETRWLTRYAIAIALLGAVLAWTPASMGQRGGGGHSGGFSGSHAGGFAGGGYHGGFSGASGFRGFSGGAPRAFSAAPRMNWNAPRYGFAPQRGGYAGYRPAYGLGPQRGGETGYRPAYGVAPERGGETGYRPAYRGENRGGDRRGGDRRDRYRRRYRGYDYGGYPYLYANSWELLPGDLGYSDFTGYGDDSDSSEPNNAQNNAQVEPNNAQEEPSGEEPQGPPEPPESGWNGPEYAPAPYPPPVNQAAAATPPSGEPELTLIFKDGHRENIRNYVLTSKEVIVMDDAASGHIPRIALSDLNLAATEKAAQQAGLDFSPPAT